jgi:hypothetical protein
MRLRHLALVFVPLFLAHAAMAETPKALDLVCTGQSTAADGAVKPFDMRLSVDPSKRRWCYRDVGCPLVYAIASIEPGKLTLLAVQTPLNEANLSVDIQAGTFARDGRIPGKLASAHSESGTCAPANYTPIK